MAKFSAKTNAASIQQVTAVLAGTVASHGAAIMNLQSTQIEQHDEIVTQGATVGAALTNIQKEQIIQADRLTALEDV